MTKPEKALIIDDNRKYTSLMRTRLERLGIEVEHMLSSKTGIEHLQKDDPNRYGIILTDITMETQVSGIFLTRKIRRLGFKGCLVIYSTGFNFPAVLGLSTMFFKILGADALIPKDGLINGKPKLKTISTNQKLDFIRKALIEDDSQ